MNRIHEEIEAKLAVAPVSLATATDCTPIYINCTGYDSVTFVIEHASMASGKKITAKVMTADDASATNAVQVGENVVHTLAETGAGVAVISVDVAASRKAFYGIAFQTDAGSAVVVSAVLLGRAKMCPPATAGTNL